MKQVRESGADEFIVEIRRPDLVKKADEEEDVKVEDKKEI